MPELPEVETIKSYLKKSILNKKIEKVTILEKKQFIGNPENIIGSKIIEINRKGKVLYFKLNNGFYINIHFKLSGQILFSQNASNAIFPTIIPRTKSRKMPGTTTRIIIYLNNNEALFFNDLRKFGWIKISRKPATPTSPDIISSDFTFSYFDKVVHQTRRPIKTLLLDQGKMAGIGNIYANEALFLSRINPFAVSSKLDSDKTKKLYESIINIIKQGIKYKGSSGKDEMYIMPDGTKGKFQYQFKVYQQNKKNCPNCGSIIERKKQTGRGSFYCPKCQE